MDGPQSYPVDRARRLAHRSGAIIGISAGVLLLPQFLQAAFTANSNDTWLTVLTGFAGLFAILPLSVLGIFRPRPAGVGLLVSLGVLAVGTASTLLLGSAPVSVSVPRLAVAVLYFVIPPAGVAALFLYASSGPARHRASRQ